MHIQSYNSKYFHFVEIMLEQVFCVFSFGIVTKLEV